MIRNYQWFKSESETELKMNVSAGFVSTPEALFSCSDLFISKTPAQPQAQMVTWGTYQIQCANESEQGDEGGWGEVIEKPIRKQRR